jgi:hypothetical protein
MVTSFIIYSFITQNRFYNINIKLVTNIDRLNEVFIKSKEMLNVSEYLIGLTIECINIQKYDEMYKHWFLRYTMLGTNRAITNPNPYLISSLKILANRLFLTTRKRFLI